MNLKDAPMVAGTAGGTLASTLPNIGHEHILITCMLAVIGATVSFVMTLILKRIATLLSRFKRSQFRKKRK